MNGRQKSALLLSAAALLYCGVVKASDGEAPGGDQEIVVNGAKVVSDATHLDAPIQDLPIAIETIPIELIRDEGFQRLGDAVRNVSGVVRKEAYLGLTDSFGIRGFDARVGLFNGFRHDFYDQVSDLAHVEKIEVIKGPASVSSGYLEPGGVVNVVTKSPQATPVTEVDISGDTNEKGRIQGDFSRPVSDTVGIRVTGAADGGSSFRDHVGSSRETIGGALDWQATSGTKVELRAYYLHTDTTPDRGYDPDSLGTVLFELPRDRYLGEPSDFYHVSQSDLSAVVTQSLAAGWTFRAGLQRSYIGDTRSNTQTDDLQPDGRTVTREYTYVIGREEELNGFAEIHGAFATFGLDHKLVAGIDYTRDTTYDNFARGPAAPLDIFDPVYGGRLPRPATVFLNSERIPDIGVYAQDLISVGDRWKLLLGLRHDGFRDRQADLLGNGVFEFEQGHTTPRAGLIYEPLSWTTLYVNYAQSFNPQDGTQLADNAKPAPELGTQYEAGVKLHSADDKLTASAALFQITKTNVATQDPNDQDFQILTGEERSRGLELDFAAKPLDGLQIIASYAYNNAEVTRDEVIPVGDRLLNVPRHQGSLWVRYDPGNFPLGFGMGVFYVGKREAYLPNTFLVPDYTRLDAAIYWPVRPDADLALNIQNLTDVKYYDSQDSYLYPGAPRTALATLRVHF